MSAPAAPLVLVVLDGWGLRSERHHNAIALARTPTYNELLDRFPHARLVASGEAVGLPAGQMGNSEVGHMNMGAGRIVYQDLTRIDKSIADGDFFENAPLVTAMERCTGQGGRRLHLLGLLSDGGVHSHQRHLHALVEMAARHRLRDVFVHALTDGRDTSPFGAARYVAELEEVMRRTGVGRLATVIGRYYGMDRDRRWDRTERAYDALTRGIGRNGPSAGEIVRMSHASGVTDEFIEPSVVVDAGKSPVATIREGDSVIFFNFRADRARQLTSALAFADFKGFVRAVHPRVRVTTMTVYDATYDLPAAFSPQSFSRSLGEIIPAHKLTNLRLAETEKYAHVTYFFNCGEERPYPNEDRLLVPSPKVATYDLQPEMSAGAITDELVADVEGRRHDLVICNFANADMVGHTGVLEAAIAAVETLDGCLARIITAVGRLNGTVVVTADHGNAEQMWDADLNAPHTAHTSNPVPVILAGERFRGMKLREGGSLRDVAPTLLGILGLDQPAEMTGRDLKVQG